MCTTLGLARNTFGITGFVKVIHRLCRFLHTPNNGQTAKLLIKMRS